MTRIVLGLLGLLLLVPPTSAQTQAPIQTDTIVQRERKFSQSSQATQMYEDIAIMRRILKTKLSHYGSTAIVKAETLNDCMKCHATTHPVAVADFDNDGRPDLLLTNPHGALTLFHNTGDGKFMDLTKQSGFRYVHDVLTSRADRGLDVEGVYLHGQGVVYTATMPPPPHDPRPGATPASNKPLSDWDRARKEIRNEKLTPEESKQPPREPGLAEVILKVLADNGKHFSLLRPEETLTVALTFRPGTFEPLAVYHDISDPAGQAQPSGGSKPDSGKQPGDAAKPATTARDYLLLGDLHLKQGKMQEAIASYESAAKIEPKLAQDPSLLERVAQAYIAQGRKDQGEAALTRARKLREDALAQQSKNTQGGESPSASLPAKLVISATKRLLDRVGNGEISYEAFKKEAQVEYLSFPTRQK
jgi:hypothetical protein